MQHERHMLLLLARKTGTFYLIRTNKEIGSLPEKKQVAGISSLPPVSAPQAHEWGDAGVDPDTWKMPTTSCSSIAIWIRPWLAFADSPAPVADS